MKITVSTTPLERQSVQVLALPIAEQATLPSWGARWPAAVREAVSRLLKEKDATGKLNEVVAIPAPAGPAP